MQNLIATTFEVVHYIALQAVHYKPLQEVHLSRYNQLIGKPVEMYAFPYGSYYACGYANKYLAGDVYKYAFSTIACPITKPLLLKRFFLPRINVNVEFINSL